jgi:hypothetical protein
MYLRVWEYEVSAGDVDAFMAAYGQAGAWAQLFARSLEYGGTSLFRDVARPSHFMTIDRWTDAASWESFQASWGQAYRELDRQLDRLASGGETLIEGPAPGG